MFTGIIEEVGAVEKIESFRGPALLTIKAGKVLYGLKKGDSVSVNGVCLTVIAVAKNSFSAEAITETLKRTNLAGLKQGDRINLESALVAGGKINGHFVTGHIDGVGTVKSKKEEKGETLFEISAPADILAGIVAKGSIAVDGVSLTVANVAADSFSVYIIPHTANVTTLGSKKPKDRVNLETDMLGKYAAKHPGNNKPSNITEEFLREKGFI